MTLSKSKLQAVLLAGICLYIGLVLYNGSVVGASVGHIWMMGDWLINYNAGFVRRGLFGELIIWSTQPLYLLLAFQTLCYALIVVFYFLSLKKLNFPSGFVFIAFTPMLFLFPILGVTGGYRKEILALVFIAINCWAKISLSDKHRRATYLVSLALWPLLVLTHEMLFLCLPIILILNLDIPLKKHQARAVEVFISISILSFILVLQFSRISAADVIKICAPLNNFCSANSGLNSPIYWLQNSLNDGLRLVKDTHFNLLSMVRYCLSLLLMSPLVYLTHDAFLKAIEDFRSKFLFGVFTIGLVALHFIAVDYGRFIHIWLFCYAFVAISGARESKKAGISFEAKHWLLLVYLPVWHFHHVSTLDISPLIYRWFLTLH